MRLMILATAATLALGVAGCQRQQEKQPAGETAAPEGGSMQQEQAPGQQPGEAPAGTQENVQPQTGGSSMQEGATSPNEAPSGQSNP